MLSSHRSRRGAVLRPARRAIICTSKLRRVDRQMIDIYLLLSWWFRNQSIEFELPAWVKECSKSLGRAESTQRPM